MNRFSIPHYRPTIFGNMKEEKSGTYIDIDDYDRKLNKQKCKLKTQQNNHNHINGALMDAAKGLSTLPIETKHQFIMTMLRLSPEIHKIIVQLKKE